MHAFRRAAQIHRGLSCGIAAADDHRLRALAVARLDLGRGIIHACTFKLREPVDRQATVLNTGCDNHGAATHTLTAFKRGAEGAVVEPLQRRDTARHGEARAKLHRLHLAAPDEIATRNAGRKSHVVLDAAGRARLPADRRILDHQGAQPLRSGIDASSNSSRTATNDQHIERFVVAQVTIKAKQARDLLRCRIRHDDVAAEDYRRLRHRDGAAFRSAGGFVTVQSERRVGNAVSAREFCNAPHVTVLVLADQLQRAVTVVELPPAARGKHRDDDVGHLGDLRHQRQHRLARHLNYPRLPNRTHCKRPDPRIEERNLPHELGRPKRGRQMPLVRVRIYDLDLAILDICEPVSRIARLGEKHPARICHRRPRHTQRRNMPLRQRRTRHLPKISPDRLHASLLALYARSIRTRPALLTRVEPRG